MEDVRSGTLFEPAILTWARENAGMSIDVLTSRLVETWKNITVDIVRSWEAGTAQPSFAQVKRLSEIYKRPIAVFLLDSPPEENVNLPDRRTLGSKDNRIFSLSFHFVVRRTRRVQELAKQLFEELGVEHGFKYRKYDLSDIPAELAYQIRSNLDISINDQFASKTYQSFFEYLRSKIESTGVITLKTSRHNGFPIEDARAFSITDVQPYLILINNKDTDGAKNFSLLHEFAHILLREAGICNNFRTFGANANRLDPLEVFCNNFAANFLVPETEFLTHRSLRNKDEIDLQRLDMIVKSLADDFKVSRFVILRRMMTYGFVSAKTYREKTALWDEEKPPKKRGRTVPTKAALASNGLAFSSLVMEAYKRKKLSYSGVSDYLGLKSKYIPGFETLLSSHGK